MAKRKKKAPKRVKAAREEGVHWYRKDSGARAPTEAKWMEHFFRTHEIVLEQDDDGRFRVPQREIKVLQRTRKKRTSAAPERQAEE